MNNSSVNLFQVAGVDLGLIPLLAVVRSLFLQGRSMVMELRVDPFHLSSLYKFNSAFYSALEDEILLQPFIFHYSKYYSVILLI